jgi:cyclopropane fatty-acyl-phospholipid synthase-like methyltransferase
MALDNAEHVAELVRQTSAKTLLDYGSGKGYQYLRDRVHDVWGGILPTCYDVGVFQLKHRPKGVFDGIICTDVMEHIHRDDIDTVLSDIFSFVSPGGFVYFNIFCNPAAKTFRDGTNVHLTVEMPKWWEKRLLQYSYDDVTIWADYDYRSDHVQPEEL